MLISSKDNQPQDVFALSELIIHRPQRFIIVATALRIRRKLLISTAPRLLTSTLQPWDEHVQ